MVVVEVDGRGGSTGQAYPYWCALDLFKLKTNYALTFGFYRRFDEVGNSTKLPTPKDTIEWLRSLKDPE